MKLHEIANLVGGELQGDGTIEIDRVAKIEEAGKGAITFLSNPRYAKYLSETKASAVIVAKDARPAVVVPGVSLLRVSDPYASFLKVLVAFHPPDDPLPPGIHPTAIVAPTAVIAKDVRIGPYVVIGEQGQVGAGSILLPGVIVERHGSIGAGSLMHPLVVIKERCVVGSRVIIHAGTVVGSDGFGFAPKPDGSYEKIPQLGIVVIEDDVEIGANCTIDRATMGETRIMKGAKLDNLIQVAHNVIIGEDTVIAAQAGISGSTRIGRRNMIGGQAGITGHLTISDGTKIGAQSGVHKSITEPGQTYFGYPAAPHREAMRLHGAISRLPDLLKTIRDLEEKVRRLEEYIHSQEGKPLGPS